MKCVYRRLLILMTCLLCIMIGCGGPRFHLAGPAEPAASSHISVILAVSDSVFSYSTIRAYRESFDFLTYPDILNWDSAGPQLYVWVHNSGPAVQLPVQFYWADSDVRLIGSGRDNPLQVSFSIDGKEFDYGSWLDFNYLDIIGTRRPCSDYRRHLGLVKSGESWPIRYPVDFLYLVPIEVIVPGLYEVRVTLTGVCECDQSELNWRGKVQSNVVRFRITSE